MKLELLPLYIVNKKILGQFLPKKKEKKIKKLTKVLFGKSHFNLNENLANLSQFKFKMRITQRM